MKRALILHGTAATPQNNWFRWLEKELNIDGYEVWLPQLPDAEKPSIATYNKFLLNDPNYKIDENTIIVGHSSGAVEILSLLQHIPGDAKVGNVYMVSAFKDNLDWDALNGLFTKPFDYERIKSKARSITLIHSDNDPYVPLEHAEYLKERLGAHLVVLRGQGHFNTELSEKYKRFPELLRIIQET